MKPEQFMSRLNEILDDLRQQDLDRLEHWSRIAFKPAGHNGNITLDDAAFLAAMQVVLTEKRAEAGKQ